jgi:hypothetical protein
MRAAGLELAYHTSMCTRASCVTSAASQIYQFQMKLNLTALIISAAFLIFGIWAVGELKPAIQPQEAKIDYSVRDSTDKVVKNLSVIIDSLRNSRTERKKIRNEVPKKVALYSDSDVVHFNDSIMSVYGLK